MAKRPPLERFQGGVTGMGSLTMTYFHTRVGTIIGAVLFHGPVRDGKGWFQDAMVVRTVTCVKGEEGLWLLCDCFTSLCI